MGVDGLNFDLTGFSEDPRYVPTGAPNNIDIEISSNNDVIFKSFDDIPVITDYWNKVLFDEDPDVYTYEVMLSEGLHIFRYNGIGWRFTNSTDLYIPSPKEVFFEYTTDTKYSKGKTFEIDCEYGSGH